MYDIINYCYNGLTNVIIYSDKSIIGYNRQFTGDIHKPTVGEHNTYCWFLYNSNTNSNLSISRYNIVFPRQSDVGNNSCR